jgi:HD-like signal output (HDOD) protein
VDLEERQQKVELLIRRVRDLSTLPTVVKKIIELTQDPDVSMADVENAVSTDPVISTRILRIVNSAYYSFFREITSLRQAIVVLGLEATKSLIYGTSIISVFGRESKIAGFSLEGFWQYSAACGNISRTLAALLNYQGHHECFMAGLVHDIGKIVLANHLPGEFEKAISVAHEKRVPLREAAEEVMGFHHGDVGRQLAVRWRLPRLLEEVIAYHDTPYRAEQHPEIAAIVRLASLLCLEHKIGVSGEPEMEINLREDPAWQLLSEKNPLFNTIDFDRFRASLDEEVEKVNAFVKAIFEQ